MIDFYNGGGVDVAILGMAEVDEEGNVNVSYFPPRTPGCGGFIDISQTAKRVIFVGTFTSGGLKVHLEGGKLRIDQEGKNQKFTKRVRQKTFAASTANGRTILYITERAVFRLAEGKGLELLEAAPGVDVDKDILGQMGFKPVMKDVKTMDQRVFKP
jgi:propionate CoA-transferase